MLKQELKLSSREPTRDAARPQARGRGVAALLCGIAVGVLAAGPADASFGRKFSAKRNEEPKKEKPSLKGPLHLDVSIAHPRVHLFDDGVPVAHAPVSTGMSGHPTPMGVFGVIQKQKWHQSNIYSG